MQAVERPSNFQCSKYIQGNITSFQQKIIRQVRHGCVMVGVIWILNLIPHSQEPIAVYCSILENSVMYHNITKTMKLSKAYQYYAQKLLGSHQRQVKLIFWFCIKHYGWSTSSMELSMEGTIIFSNVDKRGKPLCYHRGDSIEVFLSYKQKYVTLRSS